MRKLTFPLLLSLLLSANLLGQGTRHYFYLSDQRIVSLELVEEEKAILNYINFSEEFEIIQAPLLAVLDAEGHAYRGHLIEVEKPEDPTSRFQVTALLGPGQFQGYTIAGRFRFQAPPAKAFFRVGSAILELEPLSAEDFELVAAKVGEIDLAVSNRAQKIREAGFIRAYGVLRRAGNVGSEEWEKYFPELDLLPPVLLQNPAPKLPASASGLPDPVVVKVSAVVGRSGGVFDLRVVQGINPTLDAMATETVRHSWRFLPAISKSEVAESTLTLNVVFQR